jgi:F-type H+-transporting ATPase subunit delta
LKSASLQYANALADVALAQGAADTALRQLGDFAAAFGVSAELRNFLTSPGVPSGAKHDVIEKIAGRIGAGKIIRNFLFVIADHQRTHILPEIVASFQDVIRQRQGIAEAEISSAIELSAAQKKTVCANPRAPYGQENRGKVFAGPGAAGRGSCARGRHYLRRLGAQQFERNARASRSGIAE